MDQKEKLNKLFKEDVISEDDIFTSDEGFTIIKRVGIDKIVSKRGYKVYYDQVFYDPGTKSAVVICTLTGKGETRETSTGEAGPWNYFKKKDWNSGFEQPYYPVAMAEKRARSRATLLAEGLYQLEVYSEDESPEFEKGYKAGKNKEKGKKTVAKAEEEILKKKK